MKNEENGRGQTEMQKSHLTRWIAGYVKPNSYEKRPRPMFYDADRTVHLITCIQNAGQKGQKKTKYHHPRLHQTVPTTPLPCRQNSASHLSLQKILRTYTERNTGTWTQVRNIETPPSIGRCKTRNQRSLKFKTTGAKTTYITVLTKCTRTADTLTLYTAYQMTRCNAIINLHI